MTFDKAYCEELDINITAYKARRDFFAQDNVSLKCSFFCPNVTCNVELTGVNIYTHGKIKHRPHFRTKKNCKHSDDCSIVLEVDEKNMKNACKAGNIHGEKKFRYPDEFILSRPKSETANKSIVNPHDDDFDTEKREDKSSSTKIPILAKPHQTSYLENVVDSYEAMSDKEKRNNCIILCRERRSYSSTFKQIKYFTDGKNFIFHGHIEPIKIYGKNYLLNFRT